MLKDKNHNKSGWSNEAFSLLQERGDRLPVSHVVLGILGIAGIVSIAILAPNAVQILRYVEPRRWKKNNPAYRVNETLQRLMKEGAVVLIDAHSDIPTVQLTQKGKKRFCQLQFGDQNITKKVWDGKWRVVVFDILEKRRKIRNYLRVELANIGFQKLQNSVWVYPYECEEMLMLLKIDLKLGRDVLYFVTEKMDGDEYLRRLFSLYDK